VIEVSKIANYFISAVYNFCKYPTNFVLGGRNPEMFCYIEVPFSPVVRHSSMGDSATSLRIR